MRQRIISLVSIFGIGISGLLLLRFSPSGRKSHQPPDLSPPPVRQQYISRRAARLRAAYKALPSAERVRLAGGIPFDEVPSQFGSAVRDVIAEQLNARLEEVRAKLASGSITAREYEEERAYTEFVPRHLSSYRLNTNGDNFATILFRTPLPGRKVPERDAGGGIIGIGPVQ
jgi:hypothetical protein